VIFRALNRDGTPAGAQVAILGFDYVSDAQAAFDNGASVLATGRVLGPDCRPAKGRVDAFLADEADETHPSGEIAAVRTRPDGTFVLMANPRRSPIREALVRSSGPLNIHVNAIANKDGVPKLIGFASLSRMVKGGRWVEAAPVTIQTSASSEAPRC
jgi:hypothetical protein